MDAASPAKDPGQLHSEATARRAPLSLKNRTLDGAIWLSIEGIGVQGASFAVFVTLAHFVTPRDFGLISIGFVFVQSLQILAFYNVPTIAMRKQNPSDADFTTAFWITLACATLAFLLLFSLSGVLQKLFHAPGLQPVLRGMSVILLFMGLSRTHETWLVKQFRFRALAIRGLAGAAIGGLAGVALAIEGFGSAALVTQQIVNALVTTSLLWATCPWRPGFSFSRSAAAEILGFMRHITANNLVYVINQNCDVFLIALIFGPVGTGFYNVGKRIRLALQLVTGEPIKNIMLPALAEMQNDQDRLRASVLNSLKVVSAVCSPVFFGVAAISANVIALLFGPKWAQAVPVLQLLSLSGLAVTLLGYNENFFILKQKPLWCLWVSLTYTLLAVFSIFACKTLGVASIALPFVLPYIAVLPLSFWLAARQAECSLTALLAALLPGVASATGMLLALSTLSPIFRPLPLPLRVSALCLAGAAIYATLLASLWPKTAEYLLRIAQQFLSRRT